MRNNTVKTNQQTSKQTELLGVTAEFSYFLELVYVGKEKEGSKGERGFTHYRGATTRMTREMQNQYLPY